MGVNSKLRLVINEQLENVNSALLNIEGCLEVEENGRVQVENIGACGEEGPHTIMTYDCDESPLMTDDVLFVGTNTSAYEAE